MKKKYFKKTLNSDFNKSVVIFFSSGVFAHIINLIASPLLTRLYSPEVFGYLAILMSFTSIFNTFTTLRYENVILLSKNYSELILSFTLCLWINVSLFIVGLIIATIAYIFDYKNYEFIFFLIVSLLLSGFYTIFLTWNTKHSRFKSIARAKIFRSVTTSFFSIILWSIFRIHGLILSFIFGQIVECVIMGRETNIKLFLNIHFFYRFKKKIFSLAINNINFPKYTILSTLINRFNTEIPILFIEKIFGSVILGQYALAYRVISPFFIISTSFSEVYKKFLIEEIDQNGNAEKTFITTVKKLAVLSFFSVILIYIISYFFVNIFGENWGIAAEMVRYMLPFLFVSIIVSPVSVVLLLRKHLKYVTLIQIFHLFLIINMFIYAMIAKCSIIQTIQLFVIISILKYSVEFFISFKVAKINES